MNNDLIMHNAALKRKVKNKIYYLERKIISQTDTILEELREIRDVQKMSDREYMEYLNKLNSKIKRHRKWEREDRKAEVDPDELAEKLNVVSQRERDQALEGFLEVMTEEEKKDDGINYVPDFWKEKEE